MSENQVKKEKRWLFFAIGLIVGFAICELSFVVFSMIQNKSKSFTQTIEHIYQHDHEKDTIIKYVNVVHHEKKIVAAVDGADMSDSLMVETPEEEVSYDEVDFSYEETEETPDDEIIVVDKMLAQKSVKVQFKDADFKNVVPEEGVDNYLEVQQWNTPIKNRITFRYIDNVLQIKGLSLDKVEIVYYEKQYYLFHGGNYYLLESHDSFEKLGTPLALNAQK